MRLTRERTASCVLVTLLVSYLVDLRQSTSNDRSTCGPECLYVAINALKPDVKAGSFQEFVDRIPAAQSKGYSMQSLADVATEFGLFADLLRIEPNDLDWFCQHGLVILRLTNEGRSHFVLCEKANGTSFVVFDEGRRRSIGINNLETNGRGEAIVLSADKMPSRSSVEVLTLVSWIALAFVITAVFCWALRGRRIFASLMVSALVLHTGCRPQQAATSDQLSGGSLVVDGDSRVDLGIINPGDEVKVAKFTLQNRSTEEVVIEEVRTSCTCAFATSSNPRVAPGGTCEVELHVDSAKASSGEASVTAVSQNCELRLGAFWSLGGPVRTNFDQFPILDLSVGESGERAIEVRGEELDSVSMQSFAESPTDAITHRAFLEGETCKLAISVGASVNPGVYYGVVRLNHPDFTSDLLSIPWTLRVSAPLQVAPAMLFFHRVAGTQLTRAEAIVDFTDPSLLECLRVEPVPPNIDSFKANVEATGVDGCVLVLFVSEEELSRLEGVRLGTGSLYSRIVEVRH